MIIEREKIHEEFNRDTYWTRIHFESEDLKKVTVLTSVSDEYLWDRFKTQKISQEQLKEWREGVVEKWSSKGDALFTGEVYYDVYATTSEGQSNGYNFLQEEIKP